MFRHLLNKCAVRSPTLFNVRRYTTLIQPQSTTFQHSKQYLYKRTSTTLNNNTRRQIQLQKQSIFRPTRPVRDWHQHIDHKTREFYYQNVFTGERTTVQPKHFLPHDAPKESNAMSFLRNDRAAVGAHKKKSILRPVFSAFFVAAILYTLGELGYLDKLFGYVPPEKRAPFTEKVDLRAKDMLIRYEDWVRK